MAATISCKRVVERQARDRLAQDQVRLHRLTDEPIAADALRHLRAVVGRDDALAGRVVRQPGRPRVAVHADGSERALLRRLRDHAVEHAVDRQLAIDGLGRDAQANVLAVGEVRRQRARLAAAGRPGQRDLVRVDEFAISS